MANIKEYIKKVMDGTVSLEEQQAALAQVEKTIVEAKQRRDESVGQKADMVVQALKTIEAKLEAKLVELNNTPAMQGVQGPTGKAGKDGVDGKDGLNGVSGTDGKDGKDGVDGKDGISVVDAKIDFDGSLVVYLSNGNEIDCGQILPPEVAQNIIISSGGSGTSQVVTDTLVSLQTQINTLTGIDGTLGTMAQQDANAVAITGGTINNASIGATTPSTGRFSDLTDTGLTSGRVTYASTGGNLVDSANLTFNGTTLVANDITDSSLTATRVVYAGTGGNLVNASNFTYDGTNLVAGAIQNTSIGATTPSTVNATTITGQTARLNGTGQNLLLQSQTFENASWSKERTAVTSNSTIAPDGTTTADTVLADGTSGTHTVAQNISFVSGLTYTCSAFIKAGTNNFAQLRVVSSIVANGFANFDVSTGVLGTVGAGVTASINSVGSGWYRCSITFTSLATQANPVFALIVTSGTANNAESNTLATSIIIWGAQVEIGSTANTYIPTTTTAVYGTPTLSFSGVSTIGLESNGSLFVQPAGTGALQAQATTSTTAGGNARGANAVDWQMSRNAASQVASGSGSLVGGGSQNTASGFNATVVGGATNSSTNNYTFVGGGLSNTASLGQTVVTGGYLNTASGYMNFIGGGFTNSGTSGSAVTTQSGTMNGTTAVTLSGSNANIRVGQLITGTSINIFPYTYVAAISGTSLTLSQAASGSSTSTLSFFTPHGVVVGGGNNQATGSYSFIGGGGDAGTAANRNVASGSWSTVVGGGRNTASGDGSFIGGGGLLWFADGFSPNTASGKNSVICGGSSNTATANSSAILGGTVNIANAQFSTAIGAFASTRSISGNLAFSSGTPMGSFAAGVGSQIAFLVLGRQTTDATATALTSDGNAASGTNQVILPNNSAYFFTGEVISGVTGGGNTKGWTIEGVIKRGANAASTALVGTPTVTSTYGDAGASAWVIAVTADTTNGGLRVTFTGQLATTIRTVCSIRTVEMTF
jgi:hypothetical protein